LFEELVNTAKSVKAIQPQTRDDVFNAIKGLISIYVETKKPDEAAKWRKELDALAPK
jgi:hypothetical protein